MPPTIVPVTPRKAPSARRLLFITLAADAFLVPVAIWTVAQSGQWTVLIWMFAWHLALPFIPRLQRAARLNLVVRLEVSDERITAVTGRGVGSGLERSAGDLVRLRHMGSGLVLKLVGPAGRETGMVLVNDVDGEVLRRALLAHGWSVQEGEHGEVAAPETPVAVEPSVSARTTLVLREGVPKIGARSPISWILLALGSLPVVLGALLLDAGSRAYQPVLVVPWAMFLFVVWVTVAVKVQGREITVGPERIVFTSGTMTHTADRGRIAAASFGTRHLRFTDAQGRQLLWVPLKWRRQELLDLLRSQGWPVS